MGRQGLDKERQGLEKDMQGLYMGKSGFDKNQRSFESDFHREVWWWAVGIVPTSESLTDEVRQKCGADALEGCIQWNALFNSMCRDMYDNASAYLPATPRQYRDILENVAAGGEMQGDAIKWSLHEFEDYRAKKDKSKAYITTGARLDGCIKALGRTGFTMERTNDSVTFTNAVYPKIFHAMRIMEFSPNARKTPVRHHFAHCEFRQLFKSYSPDYDGLLRRVGDEGLAVAYAIHDYAKKAGIRRYIHFDIIKYKYKDIRVMDFSVRGDGYPSLCVNVNTEGADKVKINALMCELPVIVAAIDNRIRYINMH